MPVGTWFCGIFADYSAECPPGTWFCRFFVGFSAKCLSERDFAEFSLFFLQNGTPGTRKPLQECGRAPDGKAFLERFHAPVRSSGCKSRLQAPVASPGSKFRFHAPVSHLRPRTRWAGISPFSRRAGLRTDVSSVCRSGRCVRRRDSLRCRSARPCPRPGGAAAAARCSRSVLPLPRTWDR